MGFSKPPPKGQKMNRVVKVDRLQAERHLHDAFLNPLFRDDESSTAIKTILRSPHKTYKYMLITALVAKSTNSRVNTLSLQTSHKSRGAYDARTLCHKVVVPFERLHLGNVLGGSNEPFVNNPARHTHLDAKNATRTSECRLLRDSMIAVLTSIEGSDQARELLSTAMDELLSQIKQKPELVANSKIANPAVQNVTHDFCKAFLAKSCGGESSVMLIGAFEKLLWRQISPDTLVEVHHVNQSGASSREVGDIDIIASGKLTSSIEVKDKHFTEYDVDHALGKMVSAGVCHTAFVYGPHSSFDQSSVMPKVLEYRQKGLNVLFQGVDEYISSSLYRLQDVSLPAFIECLWEVGRQINQNEQTKKWLATVCQDTPLTVSPFQKTNLPHPPPPKGILFQNESVRILPSHFIGSSSVP